TVEFCRKQSRCSDFLDVEGAGQAPDGPAMREKPTLLLLHGGPGFDHSIYKPAYSSLADCAQVIYLDHRGNGRSDRGSKGAWSLAQWGDDIRAFCDVLGIERPSSWVPRLGVRVKLRWPMPRVIHRTPPS